MTPTSLRQGGEIRDVEQLGVTGVSPAGAIELNNTGIQIAPDAVFEIP